MQTGTQALRITKGWQQQKLKTAFSQENSQNDERWSKLRKTSCNKKVNGQEDHLTKASTGSKRRKRLLQEWFGDTGTIGEDDMRKERPSGMNYCNQENQSAKSPQKNNFFLEKKAPNRETCTYISLG